MRCGRGFNIEEALSDPLLLGSALGDIGSWKVWVSVLRAAFGLSLSRDQQAIFASVADGRPPPTHRVEELWVVAGRRSGKSRIAAAVATFLAVFGKHRLARGEIGHVLVLAASQAQAQTVFNYCVAFLQASDILKQEIASVTASEIRLKNSTCISVHSNSYRSVRGRTLVACVFDECAFWRDESSALPDIECYRAVRPSLLAQNGMLVSISTPYRKVGLLHAKHRDHYGLPGDEVLVVSGPSLRFNPTLTAARIDRALADDPEGNRAEWEAAFRTDLSQFLAEELIAAAIDHSRPLELPPRSGLRYLGFVDASGGRHDAYTICIAHKDGERIVCDALRGTKPPFDPALVTASYAQLAKDYRLTALTGDNYSADWVTSAFKDHRIKYVRSDRPKSALYLEALPLWARGLIAIPEVAPLLKELRLLERQTHRSGKDTVDHGKRGSDDYANALCGCAAFLCKRGAYRSNLDWVFGADTDARSWNQRQLTHYVASGGYTAPMFRRF
jgi:hypothetical protein